MSLNFSNSLLGLSLLTGGGFSFGGLSAPVESRAVRLAKAQFTAPPVTPPWREKPPSTGLEVQASAIKRLATIIDKGRSGAGDVPRDVDTAFTTYKALDRLRVLAELAMKPTTSSPERASLQKSFATGLGDLQRFLSTAGGDALSLAFAKPARRADSVAIKAAPPMEVSGKAVVPERAAALSGLMGTETFTVTLSKTNARDVVTVDLSTGPQPPTLDSVASAFNAAIAAVPMRNPDGTLALDADGNTQPRWRTTFAPVKLADGWGLKANTLGMEQVALDQVGAGDALMVASGRTALEAPTETTLMRFDDPEGALQRSSLGTILGLDRLATEAARLLPAPKRVDGTMPPPAQVFASTTTGAIASDAQGYSYIVGTTAGDLGANRSDGQDDLFLTKLDSSGAVVWQQSLGAAGRAEAAAVGIAANGDVVVAGTVQGQFEGTDSDGDMLVARFTATGEEKFATLLRALGSDRASAVAVGADGAIYLGGKAANGGGDAFLARLDETGRLLERRSIDSGGGDAVRALAIAGDGSLLALTSESGTAQLRRMGAGALANDLDVVTLGSADARTLAVGQDGGIAVAGATLAPLAGDQVNTMSGGRDGFVTRLDAALAVQGTTYLGSAGDDQIDSVAFMGTALYAGGRTTGSLSGSSQGPTDGFVTRIDAATGSVGTTSQFGRTGVRNEPVLVAAASGGDTVLGSLGFTRGTVGGAVSPRLVDQTSLRAGDTFTLRVDGGRERKLVIEASDTLATLADRIRRVTGRGITVTTPKIDGGNVLRIEAKAGHALDLIAGGGGKDALAKLGIAPSRLAVAAPLDDKAPRVRPGGSFGLDLSLGLNLKDKAAAALTFNKLKNAISMSQTAFRSLYWDSSKEALVNGGGAKGSVSPYQQAQLGRYQDALTRLSNPNTNLGF